MATVGAVAAVATDTPVSGDLSAIVRESAFWRPEDVRSSSWMEHVPFAFWLVDAIRPRSVVELGTWNGMSYLAFCQAIRTLGLPAKAIAVDTWQGDHQAGILAPAALTELRAVHDPKYAAFSRLVRATFDEALDEVADGSVDLLHIDGLHTYEAVRHDFETWLPKMSSRGVILFHDTQERHGDFGVYRLWAELTQHYPAFEFAHEHGLGVIAIGEVPRALLPLFAAAGDAHETRAVRTMFSRLGEGVRAMQTEIDMLGWLNRYRESPPMRIARSVRGMVIRARAA